MTHKNDRDHPFGFIVGKSANRFLSVLPIILVLLICCPFVVFSKDGPAQALQDLQENSKLISPTSVLKDFAGGKETTPVIVNLRDPSLSQRTDQQTPSFGPPLQSQSGASHVTRNLTDSRGRQQLHGEVRAAQDRVAGTLDSVEVRVTNRFTYLFGFSAEVTAQGLQDLVSNPDVVSVEPDRILHAHLTQGIPLMGATEARTEYSGAGLAIAICDTGVDTSHPMLGGGGAPIFNSKVIGGYDTGDDDSDPRPDPSLGSAHGTSCAGLAAGDLGVLGDYIGGVAHSAKLYAVKISTGDTGSASTTNMIEGWEWCITHQFDDPANPIMIISTSFGGGREFSLCDGSVPSMTQAAANAAAAGMTLFVSSGNDGYCDSMGWPACISHVISVGAVYDAPFGLYYPCVSADSCATKDSGGCSSGWYATDDTAADMVTSYSNTASFLTLLGPANQAYTTDIVGSGGYDSGDYYPAFGGTSAACPYTAGAGAILQSTAMGRYGHYLTPDQVKQILTDTGNPILDGKVAITKPRINLASAVDSISNGSFVLWNQPLSVVNQDTYANQDFETTYDTYDVFVADDFTSSRAWGIETISVQGNTWNSGCDLNCADSLNFQIYNDDAGVPDGSPDGGLGGGGNPPVWSLSVAPSDTQVTLGTGTGGWLSNVTLDLDTPVSLQPGTYWLAFFPTLSFGTCGCQSGRHPSDTTNGYAAQVINPGGGFGLPGSWTSVQDASTWGLAQQDLAFRLDGSECIDDDSDGYGDPANPHCDYTDLDCDDSNPGIHPGAAEVCDGADNNCVDGVDEEPFASDDCDDGEWCNGSESCAGGTCQAGTPQGCEDGVGCTADSCNEATDTCVHTPNDALCDDALWCSGVETCDPALDCQAGTPVDCSDGTACTDDSCNEGTDSCDNVPNDLNCDDTLYCNGVETCDPVLDCQAGSPMDCSDATACTDDSCNEGSDLCENVCNAADHEDPCCDDPACTGAFVCYEPGTALKRYFNIDGARALWNWTTTGKTRFGQDVTAGSLPTDMTDAAKVSHYDPGDILSQEYRNYRPGEYTNLNDWKDTTSAELVAYNLLGEASGTGNAVFWGEDVNVLAVHMPTLEPGYDDLPETETPTWFAQTAEVNGNDTPTWWCEAQENAIDKDFDTPFEGGSFSDLVEYDIEVGGIRPDGRVDLWIAGFVTSDLAGMVQGTATYSILEGAVRPYALSDEDGDGYLAGLESEVPSGAWDCDDDDSDDSPLCESCSCGEASCASCARCIFTGAQEFQGDGIDSNCNEQDDCFIATASFGTHMEGKVAVLRDFRDRLLLKSHLGHTLVETYYRYSPQLAQYLVSHESLRGVVATLLLPFVGASWLITPTPPSAGEQEVGVNAQGYVTDMTPGSETEDSPRDSLPSGSGSSWNLSRFVADPSL